MDDAAATTTLVKTSVENGVGIITLANPTQLNALAGRMMHDVAAAYDRFAKDDAVRCTLITGEGRGFCAGANLSDPNRGPGSMDIIVETVNPMVLQLANYPKPTMAAMNGPAAGFGASL